MNRSHGTSVDRVAGCLLLALTLAAMLPVHAAAQAVTGTLLGTVTDATGAVVAGAKVTITHVGTGMTRVVKTDGSGEYTAPQLPTGAYTILMERDGFKASATSGIDLGVDQPATLEHGDAGTTFGAGDGNIKAQSRRRRWLVSPTRT